jgi:hypothetical protein
VVHRADKLLRAAVGNAIAACADAGAKRALAPRCNAARKAVLAALRADAFTFTSASTCASALDGAAVDSAPAVAGLEADVIRAFRAEIAAG